MFKSTCSTSTSLCLMCDFKLPIANEGVSTDHCGHIHSANLHTKQSPIIQVINEYLLPFVTGVTLCDKNAGKIVILPLCSWCCILFLPDLSVIPNSKSPPSYLFHLIIEQWRLVFLWKFLLLHNQYAICIYHHFHICSIFTFSISCILYFQIDD